jgi:hypothetical protein
MEQLSQAVTTVKSLFARRKFPSYRPIDRAGNDEDAEVVLDAPEERRGIVRSLVNRLAYSLDREPMDDYSDGDALVLDAWPRLKKQLAQRLRANPTAYYILTERLMQALAEPPLFLDDDTAAPAHAFVAVMAPGVFVVDLFALFEVLCLGVAITSGGLHATMRQFLDCYGAACEFELSAIGDGAGLFPACLPEDDEGGPVAPAKPLRNIGNHCIVVAHGESAFSRYTETLLLESPLMNDDDGDDCGVDDHVHRVLQVVPLPTSIVNVLAALPATVPALDTTPATEAVYHTFPLWPFLAWMKVAPM